MKSLLLYGLALGGLWMATRWLLGPRRNGPIACRLGGLHWTVQDFCRGWLILGAVGSGKTVSGVRQILHQLFSNLPSFGGLVIDDKGTLHETVSAMAQSFGRKQDVMLLRVVDRSLDPEAKPVHRFNLVGDRTIPFATYARCIVDTASSLGNRREQGFFRSAAQIHIAEGLAVLAALEYDVSLENLYHLLTDLDELREAVEQMTGRPGCEALIKHFEKFLGQPAEQLAGITGTITNYLHHFTTPEVAEVFCRDSTFSLSDMEKGKLVCLALPQRLQTERRFVGTLLKHLFYLQALRRFDRSAEERAACNLLLFLADEAQHFMTHSEDGVSDHSIVDVVREAGVAFIAATQSTTSFVPVLGAEASKVLTLNLRNRLLFTAADEEDAKASAEFVGKKQGYQESETRGDGRRSRTRHRQEQYRFEPSQLRKLKKHYCVVVHAEHGYRKILLPPIEPDGTVCSWFR